MILPFFSQCLIQFRSHCILNFLVEIRVIEQLCKGFAVVGETLGHDVAELIREQRLYEHFGTVVLGIFSELFNLGVFHEHLVDALDDDTACVGEVSAEAFVHLVDDALKGIFLLVWYD